MFSFIHTGDLHLDSPLTGLSAHDDPRAKQVALAPRRAFDELVGIAIARKVDAFLIAGDLWDGDWSDVSVGLYVQDRALRLRRAGIAVFAVLGNHDAASHVTKRLREVDAIHLFPTDAPGSAACGPAIIHGMSYERRATTENLAARYPPAVPGQINIGLLHTSLDGSRGNPGYAPCSLADLSAKQYHYFALAHVHTRQTIVERPAHGGGTIAYCGVLQGRHAKETGVKGALLGKVDGDRVDLTAIDLHHVAWFAPEIDLSAAEPEPAIRVAIDEVAARNQAALGLVRLILTGATSAHHRLGARRRELIELARTAADGLGGDSLLVEDVRVATAPPEGMPMARLPSHFEATLAAAAASPEVAEAAAEDVREVLNGLTEGMRNALLERVPELAAFEERGELNGLLGEAANTVAARLRPNSAA